ncbi:MAG: hypothetical protein C0601_00975 [Candidatus Muiribacterium halophilum]|uniref:Type II secretion system protein GspG C-terminal domain-containing protein n=1 Tax=Muiribacterium halophilum TaxID=2053465 RepID=A0A2N5ZM59_MUIH1|nr:MAG: hypothetical protein C0601_00975 [Candidatus Muirbacterium halophilum]
MIKKAFTMIEVMVVVFILSVVISFFVFDVSSVYKDSKKNVAKSQVYMIRKVIQSYARDHGGGYPTDFKELIEEGYLFSLPENPLTGDATWEARGQGDLPYGTNWMEVNPDGTIGGAGQWGTRKLFDVRIPLDYDPGADPGIPDGPDKPEPIDDNWQNMPSG